MTDFSDMPDNSGKKSPNQNAPKIMTAEEKNVFPPLRSAKNVDSTAFELPYWLMKWNLDGIQHILTVRCLRAKSRLTFWRKKRRWREFLEGKSWR